MCYMSFYYIFSLDNKTEILGAGVEQKNREGKKEFTINKRTNPYPFGLFFFKIFELFAPIIEGAEECKDYSNLSVFFEDCFCKFSGFDSLRANQVFAEIIQEVFSKEIVGCLSPKLLLAKYFLYKNKLIGTEQMNRDSAKTLRDEFFSESVPIAKTLILPKTDSSNTRLIEKLKSDGSYILSGDLIFQRQKSARPLFDIPPHPGNRAISEKQCNPPYIVCKIETFSDLMLALFEVMLMSQRGRIQKCEICGSHFFAGRTDAKYCYWRCPNNPPDSRASCEKQVQDNRKLLRNRKSRLGKKIHSNYVSVEEKYCSATKNCGIDEKNGKTLQQDAWEAKDAYGKEFEEWKENFFLCKVTKVEFYNWLCTKVPPKKQN